MFTYSATLTATTLIVDINAVTKVSNTSGQKTPMSLSINSTAVGRAIEVCANGVLGEAKDWISTTPLTQANTLTLHVIVPVPFVRFTGAIGDTITISW